jgi:hypothetical protein
MLLGSGTAPIAELLSAGQAFDSATTGGARCPGRPGTGTLRGPRRCRAARPALRMTTRPPPGGPTAPTAAVPGGAIERESR